MADHLTDEEAERYVLRRLAEPGLGAIEEHLLICEECRQRVTEAERYVQAMREALRRARG